MRHDECSHYYEAYKNADHGYCEKAEAILAGRGMVVSASVPGAALCDKCQNKEVIGNVGIGAYAQTAQGVLSALQDEVRY